MSRILTITEIWQQLKRLRININVAGSFSGQIKQVDDLLANDRTGIVSTVYDFMVHSATVPMKIETYNESLNTFLQYWQKKLLNRNVNLDIPGGLRALSAENFKERWRSSLLALQVSWDKEVIGKETWIVPKNMWFLNGGAIITENTGDLSSRKFYVKINGKNVELKNTPSTSIFIRKPFTAWHDDKVVPYLVQRGTIFNALMKNAITQKQSDVIESILPILLELKAGSDQALLEGLNPTEQDFKELKNKIVDAKEKFEENHDFGDIIASLRHDVKLDYLIPDLTKIFDDKIIKSTDRNLLSSLGLIELQGFSSDRQEAIMNPKVLIEEVADAVQDWANLLEDVMIEMLKRNEATHPTLVKGAVRVIPGKVKAFITDDMRALLRSLYDRGILSKQTGIEDIADVDFEVEIERRQKEDERGLQETMKPPVIQNLEQYTDPEMDENNLEDQDKKPGTPEADNFNNAVLQHYGKQGKKKTKKRLMVRCHKCNYKFDYANTPEAGMGYVKCENCKTPIDQDGHVYAIKDEIIAPYQNIDDLPDNVKNVLPVPAQLLWLRVFNSILEKTGDEDRARRGAWSKVKEKYEKDQDKEKWVKKTTLEDYKTQMSSYTYKYFTDLYNTLLEQSDSSEKALHSALAIIESVCSKNKDGIWVKDKTLTKSQLQALDNSNFVGKVLDLELKDKKLKLIDKLLNEEK